MNYLVGTSTPAGCNTQFSDANPQSIGRCNPAKSISGILVWVQLQALEHDMVGQMTHPRRDKPRVSEVILRAELFHDFVQNLVWQLVESRSHREWLA